jgi:glutamate carboxypeptidase
MKYWLLLACLLAAGVQAAEPIAPAYRQLLETLVNINTDTRNVEGLARLRTTLIPYFEAAGLTLARHPLPNGREVISFQVDGATPGILFVGHLDTVFPDSPDNPTLTQQGDRLMGPGVIDMKGGVVLMLNVLERLKANGELGSVRVVLNDDEETGSTASKETLQALAQGIPYALVFEPGLEDGAVVSSQSGIRWIRLTTAGKAAHAGLEPEHGVDACLDMAIKVAKVAALAAPRQGLLINPGVIEGGTKPNVVCDHASVTLDVRFQHQADWLKTSQALQAISDHSDVFNEQLQAGTHTELLKLAEMPLLDEGSTDALVATARQAAQQVGQPFEARGVGYGSDGNNLATHDRNVLVGLGPYGGGMHSSKEFMVLASYGQRLELVTALVNLINHPLRKTQ